MIKACSPRSIDGLKAEARALRSQFAAKGIALRHSQALARIAERYGYATWDALVAATRLELSNGEHATTKPSVAPSLDSLKAEARVLREHLVTHGTVLRHTRALARVAEKYGYRTWEALVAAQRDED